MKFSFEGIRKYSGFIKPKVFLLSLEGTIFEATVSGIPEYMQLNIIGCPLGGGAG